MFPSFPNDILIPGPGEAANAGTNLRILSKMRSWKADNREVMWDAIA